MSLESHLSHENVQLKVIIILDHWHAPLFSSLSFLKSITHFLFRRRKGRKIHLLLLFRSGTLMMFWNRLKSGRYCGCILSSSTHFTYFVILLLIIFSSISHKKNNNRKVPPRFHYQLYQDLLCLNFKRKVPHRFHYRFTEGSTQVPLLLLLRSFNLLLAWSGSYLADRLILLNTLV